MVVCECGHDLGVHIPDPVHPFAWPCQLCDCSEYREKSDVLIYLLGAASRANTMPYVRVGRGADGRYQVYEGLTNR